MCSRLNTFDSRSPYFRAEIGQDEAGRERERERERERREIRDVWN